VDIVEVLTFVSLYTFFVFSRLYCILLEKLEVNLLALETGSWDSGS